MTKDELIEVLARRRFEDTYPDTESWEAIRPVERAMFRNRVGDDWPLIVDFVAEWMNRHYCVVPDGRGQTTSAAVQWREEMGDAGHDAG
jgi:hypothetical protein